MGHEVPGSLHHPGQVTDAQFAALRQRRGQRQARRVSERPGPPGNAPRRLGAEPACAQRLGFLQVEAQDVAAIFTHTVILTPVEMSYLVATAPEAMTELIGREVLVEPEEVVRVVLSFQRLQA